MNTIILSLVVIVLFHNVHTSFEIFGFGFFHYFGKHASHLQVLGIHVPEMPQFNPNQVIC